MSIELSAVGGLDESIEALSWSYVVRACIEVKQAPVLEFYPGSCMAEPLVSSTGAVSVCLHLDLDTTLDLSLTLRV